MLFTTSVGDSTQNAGQKVGGLKKPEVRFCLRGRMPVGLTLVGDLSHLACWLSPSFLRVRFIWEKAS